MKPKVKLKSRKVRQIKKRVNKDLLRALNEMSDMVKRGDITDALLTGIGPERWCYDHVPSAADYKTLERLSGAALKNLWDLNLIMAFREGEYSYLNQILEKNR